MVCGILTLLTVKTKKYKVINLQCSKCQSEIIGIHYLISTGKIEIEYEYENRITNTKVEKSSLICEKCLPIELNETNYDDCANCDIEFKNGDTCYTIYKISGQNIKTAISFCEKCYKKLWE